MLIDKINQSNICEINLPLLNKQFISVNLVEFSILGPHHQLIISSKDGHAVSMLLIGFMIDKEKLKILKIFQYEKS